MQGRLTEHEAKRISRLLKSAEENHARINQMRAGYRTPIKPQKRKEHDLLFLIDIIMKLNKE